MKNSTRYFIPALLGGALATAACASETLVRRIERPDSKVVIRISDSATVKGDKSAAKETVTYLGVETARVGRTLARQFGLGRDMGLVVTRIAENSPAAAVLKEDDILTKLDDQLLVDSRQLSILIRGKKEGDEVSLTIIRDGKQTSVKAKLGQHEVVRLAGMEFGPDANIHFFQGRDLPDLARLRELPGMLREDVDSALRLLGREHGNWFGSPRVHVFNRPGDKGATVLDLAQGNFVYSDDEGSVEINAKDGQRELTVKGAKGDVTFKGPINNDDDRKKLPPEVVARLNKIEKIDVGFEPGEDFEQEGAAIEPPAKTKIDRRIERRGQDSARPLRTLRPY